ncbi:MAG: hypothetical protein IJD81_09360 [Oscillospiraceae bacterium]|nr:hypothetical protein [Oscillospiraceae bacterium]
MEQIPIVIDGRECGTVRFRREGAYVVCRGQADHTGEMVRLWVYGNGTPGYLGVLIPDGQKTASIRKKFSLAEFSRLPSPMEYCAAEESRKAVPAAPTREADILWYAVGDGTLIRSDGKCRYMAFPAEAVRLPRGTQCLLRTIEGRDYVIFPC